MATTEEETNSVKLSMLIFLDVILICFDVSNSYSFRCCLLFLLQGNSILVSNLGLFTKHEAIWDYFGEFGEVKDQRYIHANDLTYSRACEMIMKSAEAVTKILGMPSHIIDNREVTVEAYLGKQFHQWLYLKGKYKLKLTGLETNLHEYYVYKKLENAFAHCGPYSQIHLLKYPDSRLTGVAEVDFFKKECIPKAVKIAREELNCMAFPSRKKTKN